MSGQPEVLDNGARYRHDAALAWIAGRFPRPLSVATGYVRLDGLRVLAELPGPQDRPVRLLIGAAPDPGLGEAGLLDEVREASQFVDRALRRLREERDFDAFPPSRRLRTLAAVDAFLASPQVEVRRYTKRFLHGKVYLFADPPGQPGGEPGAVVVTSANLTGAGLSANLELGLAHYQPGVVREAAAWFDELWAEAADVKEELRRLLFPDLPAYSPQAVFLRMLLERYGDELDTAAPSAASGLARFQEDGFRRARRIAERLGGVIYADGVGTGKTHVGLAFLRAYAVERGLHALIVAPAQLRDTTWEPARDRENLPGQVVSYQELAQDVQLAPHGTAGARRVLNLPKDTYRLVIVDEAHAFRNPDTTYYRALDRLLGGTPKTIVLLTATPVNNALWDLYHLIMLFARHDAAFAEDLGIRDLRRFFREAGANDPDLVTPARLFPLIDAVAVRRDRRFLEEHYAGDSFPDGTPVRFPAPRLLERRYDLDAAYPQAVREIVAAIGELTMARYTASRYLRSGKGEDARETVLAGLIQSGLLKRLESSAYAARETARRILAAHDLLIDAWTQHGTVPSPAALRELVAEVGDGEAPPEAVEELLAADVGARPASDFTKAFLTDVQADRERLARVVERLDAMLTAPDPKLAALRDILTTTPAKKVAVFTSFADTARYLAEALEADVAGRGGRALATVIGNDQDADERERQMARFCPASTTGDPAFVPPGGEVDLLIATDVIAEGQNLQQAQAVVSYDMPWNPQRVVQRNGRVIRLRSPHREVYLHTLLPQAGDLEAILRLEARLRAKIAAANASIGMESQVLADVAAESRIYADLRAFTDRLAAGDPGLLREGEGDGSGSFAGELYRALLARAQRQGEVEEMRAMPWGVGSGFRRAGLGEGLPAVVFAARDRWGNRHWRAVLADGRVLREDLELLRLADPGDAPRAEAPAELDLEARWRKAAEDICEAHNRLLDPAERGPRLPASQRWALDILRDPAVPDRPELAAADAALAVPRDQAVQRALAAVRREYEAGSLDLHAAAGRIAAVVAEFGLGPASMPPPPTVPLTPEDLGVVTYQVVLPDPADSAPGQRGQSCRPARAGRGGGSRRSGGGASGRGESSPPARTPRSPRTGRGRRWSQWGRRSTAVGGGRPTRTGPVATATGTSVGS